MVRIQLINHLAHLMMVVNEVPYLRRYLGRHFVGFQLLAAGPEALISDDNRAPYHMYPVGWYVPRPFNEFVVDDTCVSRMYMSTSTIRSTTLYYQNCNYCTIGISK